MKLEGKSLTLDTELPESELETLLAWFQDLEVVGYLKTGYKLSQMQTADEVAQFLAEEAQSKDYFWIRRNTTGELLGYALLAQCEHPNCREYGIVIGNRGRGWGMQATRMMMVHAFRDLGLESVCMTTCPDNPNVLLPQHPGITMEKTTQSDRAVYHEGAWVVADTVHLKIEREQFLQTGY